jgi:hypothetical protein
VSLKLTDAQVSVRVKLSALWAAVMFCYVYGDIFGLFRPGKLTDMIAGHTPIGPTTQPVLILFAVVMAVPSAMVFLSLVLPPQLARWANIVLGVLYSAIIVMTMRGAWGFYVFLGCVEVALTLAVVSYAWMWPRQA